MVNTKMRYSLQMGAGIIIAVLLGGCNLPGRIGSAEGSQPAESNLPADVCMEPPVLSLDVAAASRAPTMPEIDLNTPPILGVLGEEGAVEFASSIAPTDSFCNLSVSETAELIISRAMKLVSKENRSRLGRCWRSGWQSKAHSGAWEQN